MKTATSTARKSGPIRCLVIQMGRMGDTVQSLMALRAAKQLYPQMEIHFVARESFAAAARRVSWINEVITAPTDEWLIPILTGDRTAEQTLGDVARWIKGIAASPEQQPWDLLVNWTYSEASSFLAGVLPARVKLGYSRRNDRSFSAVDGWSHYMQAIVQGHIHQNIHGTDILTTQLLTALQIHYGEPLGDGNSTVTSKSFFELEIGDSDWLPSSNGSNRKWIGIQLGASPKTKSWSTENWADFITLLLARHPENGIVLLGGRQDVAQAHDLMRELDHLENAENILNLSGQTDFDLWASVIARCNWVLSADTAAVHLASVLGTRAIHFAFASKDSALQYEVNGPYGNGHYIVCTDNPERDLLPETVYGIWSYAATEWIHNRKKNLETHFEQLSKSGLGLDKLSGINVLRSRIRVVDDGGGVYYENLLQKSIGLQQWTSKVVGHVAREWYCGWAPEVGKELDRDMLNPDILRQLRGLKDGVEQMIRLYEEACASAQMLKKLCTKIKSFQIMDIGDRDRIQALNQKLQWIDTQVDSLGENHETLRTFANMNKVLMHNLAGEELSSLSEETAETYKQLLEGVQTVQRWVGHTLAMARPMAIPRAVVTNINARL